jgi:hypothetical protein
MGTGFGLRSFRIIVPGRPRHLSVPGLISGPSFPPSLGPFLFHSQMRNRPLINGAMASVTMGLFTVAEESIPVAGRNWWVWSLPFGPLHPKWFAGISDALPARV